MTETADTYFGFGNKHHLGDWQRRHSLFFLPVVTPQTLGRHAQTRADTRRHAQTRADTRRHAQTWHHERHFGSTLGFRQDVHKRQARGSRGEALTDAETGLALADKAQTRGTPGRQGSG